MSSQKLIHNDLKIMSWNILAPGLMLYFWRSSYGLRTYGRTKDDYDQIQKIRIDNIVGNIKLHDPDILCLQETSNTIHQYLDNMSVQEYIASKLRYTIVSESFKDSEMGYDYPSTEQNRTLFMDSGVATLIKINSRNVRYIETLVNANDFSGSKVFKSGIGSPFVLDAFEMKRTDIKFCLGNVHIRMSYPHIKQPLDEFYERLTDDQKHEEFQNCIVTGDFNAHKIIGARELFTSQLYEHMFDFQGSELIDDHVFLGNNILNYDVEVQYNSELPMLQMGANYPEIGRRWTNMHTRFDLNRQNNVLINTEVATSDHIPIIITIKFESGHRLKRAFGLRELINSHIDTRGYELHEGRLSL
uniref:Endonuclease/exonuclease/phosphatase domain-containing protein n=1 Tax=Pithovirus LCPAC404 TaxID=2506597 RepID=A0A481ZGC0_9VIRU|nr:MAG: uncharacterized protein LCPAC404_01250 [Pithovirus LCPAC404]